MEAWRYVLARWWERLEKNMIVDRGGKIVGTEKIKYESIDEKPHVFVTEITFNDGTKLSLGRSSIVVFTGPNNSGKSQVLRDIENNLNADWRADSIVTKDITFDYGGTIFQKTFFQNNFIENQDGHFKMLGEGGSFSKDGLGIYWKQHELYTGLHRLFINRLSTEKRLTSSNALERVNHPIYKLYKSEALAQLISDYFCEAFGVDLIVNRNEMQTVPLHMGQAPNKAEYTIDRQDDYYEQIAKLPRLQEQGDGMRSFASILLNTFTSEKSITLIDEPEAFLHPPQARILGKMLAKNNPFNCQLFISTHSEDFLQGLLDADNDNVTVIRINRKDDINGMSVLQNERIKQLWGNPLLRYSNILSGLFHEKVVICESDYDCLFYQAIMNAIYEQRNKIAPDVLFTHCGGKSRMKDVVSALKAVDVPVVAISDFDLLNASQNFKPLVVAFGVDWETSLSKDMKTIYDSMNAKSSHGFDPWKQIKKIGKAGFSDSEPAAYEKVEEVCKSVGLYVVPVGEMECFDKTINKEKKEWVYHVLENYELGTEPKLEAVRRFVQEVVDFVPTTI